MKQIIEQYGKAIIAAIIVTIIIGAIYFLFNDSGRHLSTTEEKKVNTEAALVQYAQKQEAQQVIFTAANLKANDKIEYSEIMNMFEINGQVGEFTSDGKQRYIKIEQVLNEYNDNVVLDVYNYNNRSLVFSEGGLYRLYATITDETGAKTTNWYSLGVAAGNGECPNSDDGAHNYEEDPSQYDEPTCIKKGYKVYKCIYCDDEYKETLAKSGHDYVESVITAETCTAAGKHVNTCSRCGNKQYFDVPALGHTKSDTLTQGVIFTYKTQIIPMPAPGIAAYDCYGASCAACGAVTGSAIFVLTSLNYYYPITSSGQTSGVHCSYYPCVRCGAKL